MITITKNEISVEMNKDEIHKITYEDNNEKIIDENKSMRKMGT